MIIFNTGLGALWGSIRSLYMAVYPSLSNINYPAQNLLFLTLLITFANMDPFASLSEEYVMPLVPLIETDPFNR